MINNNTQLNIWESSFGKEYTDRNNLSLNKLEKLYKDNFGITRTVLNSLFLNELDYSNKILEVGSNFGIQLLCLQKMGFKNLYGIEPQDYAVDLSKKKTKNINIIKGNVFNIPFKYGYFDMVFTSGVLIHINPKDIESAIREIYRCSNKYIWGLEYYADKYTEIIYRGRESLLWKADFPKIYMDTFPDLKVLKIKFLKYLENDNTDVMFLLKKGK